MHEHHRRIHPINYPILAKYSAKHPAVRALEVHAEARDQCVAKEIEWPQLGNRAIDQEWFSANDQRVWKFSAFAYVFISFDLVLDGWLLDDTAELQPFEFEFLHELPRLRQLLDECECAALTDKNTDIVPLILKAREFFRAFEESISARLGQVDIDHDERDIYSLWGTGKCER